MIKNILKIGNQLLLDTSQVVSQDEFNTIELDDLIMDMRETMYELGGVGISAIQIGIKKRLAIIEYDGSNPRYKDIGDCPLTVIINPEIQAIGDETSEYNEGCLSVPDIRGEVIRPKHIRYKFYNQYGALITGEDSGFFARVIQHEIVHMNGVLFVTKSTNLEEHTR